MARIGRVLRTLAALAPVLAGPGCHALSSARTSADDSHAPDPDAKAVRVELTPARGAHRVGGEQVLIATVYDADGRPRRSRRVEWAVDGPGTVAAVDESGWLRGRGYKVDDTHAVSHTDYREHTVTHGKHTFTVGPGQTWLVVTSSTEGRTTVTARAPEVADPDAGRAAAALTWGDDRVAFPPPVVGRPGGDAELVTKLPGLAGADSPDGLKVRYRVAGGAPAVLVARGGTGNRVSQQGGLTEIEVAADADGRAGVRVAQPTPQTGMTKIVVEVVKGDGKGAGTVVESKETVVEWAAAELTLDVQAPKAAAVDAETPLTVVLANAGKTDSPPVTVRLALPDAAEVVRADPPPTVRQSRGLTWNLDALPGGKTQSLRVTVRPLRPGGLTLTTTAETAGGMYAEQRSRIDAGTAGLQLSAEGPGSAGVGDAVTVQVGVTNRGSVPLQNATAWVSLDAGLEHTSGESQAEVPVGTIGPGETKRVDVRLTAKQSGRQGVRVNATADGGLSDRVETAVDVRRAALTLKIDGPDKVTLGQDATWQLRVTNDGDGPVPDVVVRAAVPQSLRVKSASDGGQTVGPDGVEWSLGTLAAGENRTLRLTAAGADVASRAVLTAKASAGSGRGPEADAEVTVAVAGQPAVVLEVGDTPATVPVGGRAPVRVTVRNRGSGPARNVEVIVAVTEELATVGGIGADRKAATAGGARVTFGTLAELPAGSSAVFVAEVEGAKPGPARVQVEARAAHLTQPLREEQPARVVGR